MPEYYCALVRAEGTEVERGEVSNSVPKTIGWNLSLEAGRLGLGKDVSKAITEDTSRINTVLATAGKKIK